MSKSAFRKFFIVAALSVGVLFVRIGRVQAQPETKPLPGFEVVTVKPTDPTARGGGIKGNPGGQTFVANNLSLRFLIKYAYKIADEQVSGGPDWLDKDHFDIRMKTERPIHRTELPALVQSMLADRFKSQFHREKRVLSAVVLSLDKNRSKMKPNDGPDQWEISMQPLRVGPPPEPLKWKGTRCSMVALGYWISQLGNRPVVDQTGLKGYFDFTLEYAPDLAPRGPAGPNGEAPPSYDGPTLLTALREQLGLKMESSKAPVDVFVVDRAEKPTEN